MTLTFECDLDMGKKNQRAKYLDQRSFSTKIIFRHIHARTGEIAVPDKTEYEKMTTPEVGKRYLTRTTVETFAV